MHLHDVASTGGHLALPFLEIEPCQPAVGLFGWSGAGLVARQRGWFLTHSGRCLLQGPHTLASCGFGCGDFGRGFFWGHDSYLFNDNIFNRRIIVVTATSMRVRCGRDGNGIDHFHP